MSLPVTRACAGCAAKLDKRYYMDELEEEPQVGQCPWCYGWHSLSRYAFEPRRPVYRRSRGGGGERKKAGGG